MTTLKVAGGVLLGLGGFCLLVLVLAGGGAWLLVGVLAIVALAALPPARKWAENHAAKREMRDT